MTDASPRTDGRSDHKAATRQALIDAALQLFAAKGYDATSTEEIAEQAGVSPRTFFRYFETKDRVLFFGGDDFNRDVVRQLPLQPLDVDDLTALEATMLSLTPLVVRLKRRIRLYYRALDSSTALLGQHAAATARHHEDVAVALAARRSLAAPDEQCRLTAALAGLALDRAYHQWLDSRRDLTGVITESFAAVRTVAAR